MKEIEITSQEQLDNLPIDYNGRIIIKFGTSLNPAIIKNKTQAELWENSSAMLWENSSAVLRENSSAVLWGNSRAVLWENSSAVLRGNSRAVLWENSSAVLWGNSSAVLWGNSRAVLWENSSAVLRENSSAVLWGNSSAELWENSQVIATKKKNNIEVSGNSRIVYLPTNINEYTEYYGLQIEKETQKIKLYKAVRKYRNSENHFYSNYDSKFEYTIGEISEVNDFDDDTKISCGRGIHLSYLEYALRFGREWDNLAIIEVECDLDDIVVPQPCEGKVRAKKCKVLREVPIEEFGLYGEIFLKQR